MTGIERRRDGFVPSERKVRPASGGPASPAEPPPPPSAQAAKPRGALDQVERPRDLGPFGAPAPSGATDRFDHDHLVDALAPAPEPVHRLHVARLRWKQTAPGLRAASSANVDAHLSALASSLGRAREALWTHDERNARVRYGVERAGLGLERLASRVGSVHEIVHRLAHTGKAGLPSAVAEGRRHLQEIRHEAEDAGQELREVVGRVEGPAVGAALGETERLQASAQAADGKLRLLSGRAAVLEELDAGHDFFTEEAAAPASTDVGEEDLARLGSALDPARPPPQILWNESMVNRVSVEGRAQGGLSEEQGNRHAELARSVVEGHTGGPLALGAADLAALLSRSGLALERVDPHQVMAASRFLGASTTLADQQERLRKVLDGFHTLDRIGLPRVPAEDLRAQLDTVAKIPHSATKKLGEAELRAKFNEVAATLNGGGELRTKVGSYDVTLKVDETGRVKQASAKKPGLFSRIGSALRRIAPIALTALSFIPATAPFARLAQGAISLVSAIRNRSALGMALAGVSIIGAGAAGAARTVARGAAGVLGRVESLANSASRALQGVSSLRQRSFVAGIAGIGGALADGIKSFSGSLRAGLEGFANTMGTVSARLTTAAIGISAVDSYRAADKALALARERLAQVRASGNPALVAAAEQQVDRAERARRAALLGGAAAAAGMAADIAGDRRPRPSGDQNFPPPRSPLEAQLRLASRSLGVAQGVAGRDFVSAGVNAVGAAASRQAMGRDFDPEAFHPLTSAANLADAALGYHQARQAEAATSEAVKEAEAALTAARRSGRPEAVAAARAALARARRNEDGALVSAIGAGDSLLKTGASLREQHDVSRERERGQLTRRGARELTQVLLAVFEDPHATAEDRRGAAERLQRLAAAGTRYDRALESGRLDVIRAAREAFDATQASLGVSPPEPMRVADGLIGFPREKPVTDASKVPVIVKREPIGVLAGPGPAESRDIEAALLRLLDSTAGAGPGAGPRYEKEIRQLLEYLEKMDRARRKRGP